LVTAGALVVILVVGHFLAEDLAEDPVGDSPALWPTANWTELQDFFDDCLAAPVPWSRWLAEPEAGLLVVLVRLPVHGQYQVVACFATANLGILGASAELAVQMVGYRNRMDVGAELVVTWCGTGGLDPASRERFQREFQAEFLFPGGD